MRQIPSIEVNFEEFKEAKNNLKDITERIKLISNKSILTHINETKEVWDEETCNAFLSKEAELSKQLRDEAMEMERIVDEIEQETFCLFDAEVYSRGLAINRSY